MLSHRKGGRCLNPYVLYNNDVACANFSYDSGLVKAFEPILPGLLPMQLHCAGAEGFSLWLSEWSIDLSVVQHRKMVSDLLGSRDKVTLALMTHMFSISDTFTCFPEGEFTPRRTLCSPQKQQVFSDYILISSDTPMRKADVSTPNISTDGSFTKTWKFEKTPGGFISSSRPPRPAGRWRSAGRCAPADGMRPATSMSEAIANGSGH